MELCTKGKKGKILKLKKKEAEAATVDWIPKVCYSMRHPRTLIVVERHQGHQT